MTSLKKPEPNKADQRFRPTKVGLKDKSSGNQCRRGVEKNRQGIRQDFPQPVENN